jgi:3-oxoacyl-[acyl-carrier-protein] synthase II
MGALTAAGLTVDSFFERVCSGESAISAITRFDTTDFKAKLAAEIKDFNPDEYISDRKEVRRMDRYCQYAMGAARDAFRDSGLDLEKTDLTRAGVIYGSGVGGLETFEIEHTKLMEKGAARVSPLFVPMMISNIAAGNISKEYGLKSVCICPVTACATGAHAIGEAYRHIKHGYSDIIIAGGSEAAITKMSIAGFTNMTALSTADDPQAASLPFDARREGFIMGEGAGALILESLDHALARGAKIYAELAGYGATGDAHHITAPIPDGSGAARAMTEAMNEAGVSPSDISYINAHGTGTPPNDKYETLAIKTALGKDAYRVPISSSKGVIGHMLGAAGAVEAIICVKAINGGIIPPTANLRQPDPDCDLDYVPLTARRGELEYALSNSLGFGGTNASLLLKKYRA